MAPVFSSFVDRIGGEGAEAWEVHILASRRIKAGEDVVNLSIGDPDFVTDGAIIDAAVDSLRRGRTHYTNSRGEPELLAALASHYRKALGRSVSPGQFAVCAGAQNALFASLLCLLDRGDEIIVLEPTYVTYEAAIGASGATQMQVPLRPENGFHLDPSALAAAVTPRTKAIAINTPHNPTGAVMTQAELQAVADLAIAHDLWVISDEVYAQITFEGDHHYLASLPGMAERCVIVSSLSKSHAMTGWRLGWIMGPEVLIGHVDNLLGCMLYGSPPFIQDAAIHALGAGQAVTKTMVETYRKRRDFVCDRLARMPLIAHHKPEGGMFAMIDVRATGMSGQDFAMALLEQQGVALLPGEAFGPSAAGHVRFSLVSGEADLTKGCDRLHRFLTDLKTRSPQNVKASS